MGHKNDDLIQAAEAARVAGTPDAKCKRGLVGASQRECQHPLSARKTMDGITWCMDCSKVLKGLVQKSEE